MDNKEFCGQHEDDGLLCQGTPEKGGEVAEKGGTTKMEVAGIDIICVSVGSLKKTLTLAKKTHLTNK